MFWADNTLVLVHQEQDFKVLSFCCKQCLRNIQSITAIPVEICKHSNHAADVASRGLKAGKFLMSDAWLSNLHTVFGILSGTGLASPGCVDELLSDRWCRSQGQSFSQCATEFQGRGCNHSSGLPFLVLELFEKGRELGYQAKNLLRCLCQRKEGSEPLSLTTGSNSLQIQGRYFGPFEVRSWKDKEKKYGGIITCLAIQTIHTEAASSLDRDLFINALWRFVARHNIYDITWR